VSRPSPPPQPIFAPAPRAVTRRAPAALEIEVAVAKLPKHGVDESGDTVEVTERPHGGLSVVLADGQGSGRAAKTISNMVVKKAINLLADGTRDGAAARAVHDFLYAYRHGQVSSELTIISADLVTHSIVVSRNTHCPALLLEPGRAARWDEPASPIGLYPNTKPLIRELPVAAGTAVIAYSDGIHEAGQRTGRAFDPLATLERLVPTNASAQDLAAALLDAALATDDGRPGDDMTVAILLVRTSASPDRARRLTMRFPID
jgi:serine phosphatase RsbU (regulator of sigma subunit)